MRPILVSLTALLLLASVVPPSVAHVYNFEDRHETCDSYTVPNAVHSDDDGHAHYHHYAAAATGHYHADLATGQPKWYPAGHDHPWTHTAAAPTAHAHYDPATGNFDTKPVGHTHPANYWHDPCDQVRMDYPDYENLKPLSPAVPPVEPIDPEDILYSDGDNTDTEAFVGGEYYQFPLAPTAWKRVNGLAVTSDSVADGIGFPGAGTPTNPYIVEGYIVTGNMLFKDTSRCFVIRNNIIVNSPRVILSPIIPDPFNIVNLPELTPYWEQVKAQAEALRQEYLDLSDTWDSLWATWNAQHTNWQAQRDGWEDQLDAFEAEQAQWQAQFEAFEDDYYQHLRRVENVANAFDADSDTWGAPSQPAKTYLSYVNYATQDILDMDGLMPEFEAYQEDLEEDLGNDDVEGWIRGNWPPQQAPPGYWGTQQDWDYERANYVATYDDALKYVDDYWSGLIPTQPDVSAYQAFLAEFDAFLVQYDAFYVDYDAFMVDYNEFMDGYDAFQAEFDQVWADTGQDIANANAHFAKVANFDYEYVGQLGSYLFNEADELVEWALQRGYGIVDALVKFLDELIPNPNLIVQNTGQLILDWNGQCIHAFNNVIHDLRVNQNNARTGFATGGVIEDNRIFVVGQIRHYDGIFRDNEVGNKAHLLNLMSSGTIPVSTATPAQAVNNDGANQGWYYDNVIYGNVDLDFHGHHHSAGFFATKSHYHGNTKTETYMQTTTGTCTATWSNVNQNKTNGPEKDYPRDNDVHVFGDPVLVQADPQTCLLHQDHGKRWTSVFFNDNVVIDPNGNGIRFEDRNHRADDEQANSENLAELKKPHFHQKWVQLEDNVVVGKLFVDILNAQGTLLWNDNWAAVTTASGAGRTVEALSHPGAEIVTSHPYRNDAWLDIERNHVYLTQSVGIQVADAEDLTLFQLKDNVGFGLRRNFNSQMTPEAFVAWLKASPTRSADATWGAMTNPTTGWGGTDRGVQTMVTMSYLRDDYLVRHCGQVARGLDNSIIATDRIYEDTDPNDDLNIIRSCGTNDWGPTTQVPLIAYTQYPAPTTSCTKAQRAHFEDTDDFYATELVFDTADPVTPAAVCQQLQTDPGGAYIPW